MMYHSDRAFSFAEIESEDDLVEVMFNHKWSLCYSFYHKKLLYLNDGENEDSPEYAIVTIDKTVARFGFHGREVGRIRPAIMPPSEASKFIQDMNAGNFTGENPVQFVAEPKWHHRCHLCGLEGE
jgi:hypothetical protein